MQLRTIQREIEEAPTMCWKLNLIDRPILECPAVSTTPLRSPDWKISIIKKVENRSFEENKGHTQTEPSVSSRSVCSRGYQPDAIIHQIPFCLDHVYAHWHRTCRTESSYSYRPSLPSSLGPTIPIALVRPYFSQRSPSSLVVTPATLSPVSCAAVPYCGRGRTRSMSSSLMKRSFMVEPSRR